MQAAFGYSTGALKRRETCRSQPLLPPTLFLSILFFSPNARLVLRRGNRLWVSAVGLAARVFSTIASLDFQLLCNSSCHISFATFLRKSEVAWTPGTNLKVFLNSSLPQFANNYKAFKLSSPFSSRWIAPKDLINTWPISYDKYLIQSDQRHKPSIILNLIFMKFINLNLDWFSLYLSLSLFKKKW